MMCDCNHPVCNNCEKRGHKCSFLLLAPSSQLSTKRATSPHSATSPEHSQQLETISNTIHSSPSAGSPYTPPPASIPPYLRCDDVWKDARQKLSPDLHQLLYHFELSSSLTLASQDPAKEAWQVAVPQLAARHDFLTHQILAIASLHLGRLHMKGDERTAMMNMSASQMNKALSRYRPALENINAENASALFAGATLTAVYMFRQSTMEIDEIWASVPITTACASSDVSERMLNSILRIIWGLRGPLAVLIPGFQYVLDGQMGTILNRNWWPQQAPASTEQAMDEDRRLARIADLWKDEEIKPGSSIDPLTSALLYLREAYALVSVLAQPDTAYPPHTSICYSYDGQTEINLMDRGAIFYWATKIPREFVALLEQKNVVALVIVAHYAVLPGRVRNTWWLENLGPNMVIAVAVALGRDNWHLIEWPVKVLNVDLENAFTAKPDKLEGNLGEVPMEII
ncbi:hypothetical protein DM02DRAFT_4834 [Periconia macrospinosa]|uniref:Zn(2)-C6 fungal-type domain-containing protein n=1 Tax=Periconia macrospinosa TaxID=97972 RepID=A0A2V1EDA9_9PLEO|nr:hypothetical protein DM02DRAFT_4834 [Periconia macrospinosa]